jgi:hypothetical protein
LKHHLDAAIVAAQRLADPLLGAAERYSRVRRYAGALFRLPSFAEPELQRGSPLMKADPSPSAAVGLWFRPGL